MVGFSVGLSPLPAMTDSVHPAEARAAPEQALVGQVLAERYRVERLLGAGGMGSVYLAEHVLMRKAVALKVLHREMTALTEVVARFEREAVAAARIDHPNVASAMDFGRLDDGSFYLVLEYIDGKSLSSVIAEGCLDLDRALVIAIQIGNALIAAHAAGIVHRDLKPDNVMLVANPEGHEIVKVLDFGIAKVQGQEERSNGQRALTRIGTVMGTAGYMAPEQALGQTVDARVDLYALGVVLYEMVTGNLPFPAEEPSQILAKQLTEPIPPLPEGTPVELCTLIERLLDNKVEQRPLDAAEVVQTLIHLRDTGSPLPSAATVFVGEMPPVSTQAVTTSVKRLSRVDAAPSDPPKEKRGLTLIAAVLAALVAVVAVVFWTAKGPREAEAAAGAAATSANPETRSPPAPSSTRPAPARQEPAATSASSETSATETKTTTTADGRTVTQTRSTRHTTSTERRTSKKRNTGPGGIYIPPPSDWFK